MRMAMPEYVFQGINWLENKTENDADLSPAAIEPPGKIQSLPHNPIKLIFETAFLFVAYIPMLIWSIIQYLLTQRKSVKGKVVLVTGSGRGLGRGFVEKFAQLGCKVACVDIDPTLNCETAKLINEKYPGCAKAYICNVALPSDIKALKEAVIKDFGQVNIIVHNAAIMGGSDLSDIQDTYLFSMINVNLTSHFLMLREFLPDMIERNEGHYVAIGSVASFNATKSFSIYCATKHGVFGLMNSLQDDLESRPNNKVQASIVCPYFINTSALYARNFRTRIPELSIKYTVAKAVDGILKNRNIITIPAHLYYLSYFLKFVPHNFLRLFQKVYYTEIFVPPIEEQINKPLYQHLKKSFEKYYEEAKKE